MSAAVKFAVLLLCALSIATAQDITIRAVDGKSGKPIADHRLLIFLFDKTDNLSRYLHSVDVQTDRNGIVVLPGSEVKTTYFEVRVDFETLCAAKLKDATFSVADIRSHGLAPKNNCSSKFQLSSAPNEVVVYARSPTLTERMRW